MFSQHQQKIEQLLSAAEEHRMKGQTEQAFHCYAQIEQWFKTAPSIDVWQEGVAQMFYAKAMLHSEQGDITQELNTYRTLVDNFAHSSDISVLRLVAEAWINMSYTLHENGKLADAIGCFDQIMALFSQNADSVLQDYVEKARDIKTEWSTEIS